MRMIGSAVQQKNVVLLQRTWRASICRRLYSVFQHQVRYSKITELCCGVQSDRVQIRLGVSFFPITLYYKTKPSKSNENWSIADREKFMSCMREQIKLKEKARRHKICKVHSTRRVTKKIDKSELRREMIRKNSRRKFKWFYDRNENNDDTRSSSDEVKEETQSPSEATSNGVEGEEDTDLEVMSWLNGLDLNNYPEEL